MRFLPALAAGVTIPRLLIPTPVTLLALGVLLALTAGLLAGCGSESVAPPTPTTTVVAEEEVAEEEVASEVVADESVTEEAVADEAAADQGVAEEEVTSTEVDDDDMTYEETAEDETADDEAPSEELTDEELAAQEMTDDVERVGDDMGERVLQELDGRSFRQFDPGRDGDPRKGVILDFSAGPAISVWAQYAEGGYAIDEWEIVADRYRIEWDSLNAEATIEFTSTRFVQTFPEECVDCVSVSVFSISIRNVFNSDRIAFRLNDPDNVLPSPFPIFETWTRFSEDEYFD